MERSAIRLQAAAATTQRRGLRPGRRRAHRPDDRLLPQARRPAFNSTSFCPAAATSGSRSGPTCWAETAPLDKRAAATELCGIIDRRGSDRGGGDPNRSGKPKTGERSMAGKGGGPLHAWHGHFEAKRVPEGVWMRCEAGCGATLFRKQVEQNLQRLPRVQPPHARDGRRADPPAPRRRHLRGVVRRPAALRPPRASTTAAPTPSGSRPSRRAPG